MLEECLIVSSLGIVSVSPIEGSLWSPLKCGKGVEKPLLMHLFFQEYEHHMVQYFFNLLPSVLFFTLTTFK